MKLVNEKLTNELMLEYNIEEDTIVRKTERLKILCLCLKDMELLTKGIGEEEFEKSKGFTISKPNEIEKELAREFYSLALNNEKDRLWFRLWRFISVQDNKKVGGVLFKGAPNENGEVEIGYGIDDEYQCQGYATEAIKETIKWALEQEGVLSVIAETEKDNIPSQKVLQKIGMIKYAESDTAFLWRM